MEAFRGGIFADEELREAVDLKGVWGGDIRSWHIRFLMNAFRADRVVELAVWQPFNDKSREEMT